MQVYGVDFTCAPRRAKPITVACGRLRARCDRAALQAAWAASRAQARFGIPLDADPLEGWIVTA